MNRHLVESDTAALWTGIDRADAERLLAGAHEDPHRILGAHSDGRGGVVVRAHHPEATAIECLRGDGEVHAMTRMADPGLFGVRLPDAKLPLRYRLRLHFDVKGDANGDANGGSSWERDDPYRFPPSVGEADLRGFGEGSHRRLWEFLGAHPRTLDGAAGTAFAVWAPNAMRVSVVGDFCAWDGRLHPMRRLASSGVFELFVPDLGAGTLYRFEILTREGRLRVKADPMAREAELPPGTASRVNESHYEWGDAGWLAERAQRDPLREPMCVYEVHLGSWQRVPEEDNRCLTYRELAPRLVDHARRFGFTHLELLPVFEHPHGESLGYEASAYYAPTARYGTPDDFRFFVDHCHRHGIGVILDWVPAHFPGDEFALREFDGTTLYENTDAQRGGAPRRDAPHFDYAQPEVRSFLVANALYWISEMHVDGLRVDALASMLRSDDERRSRRRRARERPGARALLEDLNGVIAREHPGCVTIAEEASDRPDVTKPSCGGGLGFTFRWDLGWARDALGSPSRDPGERERKPHPLGLSEATAHEERFVTPLSHDEVVPGKGSLLTRMDGDAWQRFANLRLLLTYQRTRPGKPLLFMGTELAPDTEWNRDASLDWHRADEPARSGIARFLEELGRLYLEQPPLWRWDHDPCGFQWIDSGATDGLLRAFLRRDGDAHLVVVLNRAPVPCDDYRIGVPAGGRYRERLCSDASRFGGSGHPTQPELYPEPVPHHGLPHSLQLRLPPLCGLILVPDLR